MLIFIAFIFGFAISVTSGNNGCPSSLPGHVFQKSFQDRCYAFFTHEGKDYDHAKVRCNQLNGTLAMPKTKLINDFLAKVLKSHLPGVNCAWIGLNEKARENHYVWEDGQPLNYPGDFHMLVDPDDRPHDGAFQHWAEDCVTIDSSGFWRNFKCKTVKAFGIEVHNERDFICEFGSHIPGVVTIITPSNTRISTQKMITNSPKINVEVTTNKMATAPTIKSTGKLISAQTNNRPTRTKTTTTRATETKTTKTVTKRTTGKPRRTTTTTRLTETTTTQIVTKEIMQPKQTTKAGCPKLDCEKKCGLNGYQLVRKNGCSMCFCHV